MPSLKDLRNRKKSIQSTQKITAAMKMVAGAKLRRAQQQVEASRPYGDLMEQMIGYLTAEPELLDNPPPLLIGTGKEENHLVLVATSDRGLCGGFNGSIIKATRRLVKSLQQKGCAVHLFVLGRKGRDLLKREFGDLIIESIVDLGKPAVTYRESEQIARRILALFKEGQFDVCTLVYNQFKSALTQIVSEKQIIPFKPTVKGGGEGIYEFEPSEDAILERLLPENVAVQIFRALLENAASEQGARMTAMDSATRNAKDMIQKLELAYNRTRQAYITKELIEIISGAEAV